MTTDTRQALLDAAERAILEDGFARASTRRIAAQAEVPLSLLHYHFGGKESLLVALVERTAERNRAAVLEALERSSRGTAPAGAPLAVARSAFLDDEAGMRLLIEMSVAALHSARMRAELGRLYGETMASLGRVQGPRGETGEEQARRETTAEFVASLVLATGLGLALQRMLGMPKAKAERAFDVLTAVLVAAAERGAGVSSAQPG
jgi:AcrR family transcriptional regulator